MKRRDFLRHSALVSAGLGLGASSLAGLGPMGEPGRHGILTPMTGPAPDPYYRELALRALDAAQSAGAGYADFRVGRYRSQSVSTRDQRVTGLSDNENLGFGLRVLVDGTWGFSASGRLEMEEVVRIAQQAVAQARANRAAQRQPVELAPTEVHPDGRYETPIQIDPFSVPIQDKVALLRQANAAAGRVSGIQNVTSSMSFRREEKFFASTEGTFTNQIIYNCNGGMNCTAVSSDGSDFQSRSATDIPPRGLGYEYILDSALEENGPVWAEEAVQKLSARSVEPGLYDLILLPSHLWLTIHESIAHPTELDRIMGFEANYAGTSFIAPPEDFLGQFRYGPEFMNIQGERSATGALSTVGYDDEGVAPQDYLIVRDGLLWDLQTTREQALWLADWYSQIDAPVRSHGNSYASNWSDVQFQRMPNVNLLPHPDRDVSLEELIDGVENGIMIDGSGSFSIDQQRYNSQYGGQVFWEIRNGQVTGMLKDVAYQIRTPEFWNSMDLLGGPSTYFLGGAYGDAKGQPAQSNAVSHGCVPTRHRGVTVINTARAV
ncbi:MAG: metallopeptidase TldD-related protein [Gemmatimonadota bacterium]